MTNIIILVSIFLIVLISPAYSVGGEKDEKIFNDFLHSKDIRKEEQAYWYILRNKEKFSDKIFQELIKYQNRKDIPDKLIYLATIFREERFIKPLVGLFENPKYSEEQCIYCCPIIFSLTIYACFSDYLLPPDLLKKKLTSAVWDLEFDIKRVKNISLEKESARKYVSGPRSDQILQAYESLTTEQLVELAGPYNEDYDSRFYAAFILSYFVDNDEHILRLYWSAIKEVYGASGQYRGAIYEAIYRAETARSRKQGKKRVTD